MIVNAVIAAAGLSSRLGAFKPLIEIDGKPVLLQEIETLLSAGVSQVVVVTGHRAGEVRRALKTLSCLGDRVITAFNAEYEKDMFRSVVTGVQALSDNGDSFFFLPADCPCVRADTLILLQSHFSNCGKPVVFPVFAERRGHPPLISYSLIADLLAWDKGGGLKTFLGRYPFDEVAVNDMEILNDIDTPSDFEKFMSRCAGLSYRL